jgi:hypothetical protein
MRRAAAPLLAAIVCAGLWAASGLARSAMAHAQMQRGPVQRVIEGKVQDKSGAPLQGAAIYLKDTHTLAIQTFLSSADGSYHIGQLSPNADYDVWAELNGKHSATKSISAFNTHTTFTIDFKIDTSK